MRSKCPVYVINPSVMRDLNLKATTGSDPGIPYTAMTLCATAKVFASPRTVFTQMDAVATILLGLETYGVCSRAVSVNTYVCISVCI